MCLLGRSGSSGGYVLRMSSPELSFEEWFSEISTFDTNDEMCSSDLGHVELPPSVIATYLEKLLIEAPVLCNDILPRRLGYMIYFFQGRASEYWVDVLGDGVSNEQQVLTVRALEPFYTKFLDPYFLDPNRGHLEEARNAVYMMWDLDCIEGAAMFPGREHLVGPILDVLSAALRCKSFECQQSALHGLGHLEAHHPQRVHLEIDRALKKKGHLKPALLNYAHDARKGAVE